MIEQTLNALGIEYKATNKGWLNFRCPLAKWNHESGTDNNPSCGVCRQTFKYRCLSCGAAGKFSDLLKRVAEFSGSSLWGKFADEATQDSAYLISLMGNKRVSQEEGPQFSLNLGAIDHWKPVANHAAAEWYINEKRGIDLGDCLKYDLRYDVENQRVVFPIFKNSEQIYGAVGRDIADKPRLPYYNYFEFETGRVLGGYHQLDNPRAIGLVEGFFDIVNAWRIAEEFGIQLVCSFSRNFQRNHAELLAEYDCPIYNFYDQDKAGNSGNKEAHRIMKEYTYKYNRVTWNTTNDLGDMTKDQLRFLFDGLV